jgi:hypothetical protein
MGRSNHSGGGRQSDHGSGGRRLASHGDLERGAPLDLIIEDETVVAYAGESVAAAMIATGWTTFRRGPKPGQVRGLYCGMGVCFECLVTIDGHANQRACMCEVLPGMRVETQAGWGPRDRGATEARISNAAPFRMETPDDSVDHHH